MTVKLTPGDAKNRNDKTYSEDACDDPDDNDDDNVASDVDLLLGGMTSPLL